jgi:hypothetical protein
VPLPDVVSMQTRQANLEGAGEIPLRRVVKEALRMRPSRIVVGEVRQEECLDLLIALNSGLPGIANCGMRAAMPRGSLHLVPLRGYDGGPVGSTSLGAWGKWWARRLHARSFPTWLCLPSHGSSSEICRHCPALGSVGHSLGRPRALGI